ncbi:MAG: HAD family hydrolase [Lachnospiraceae bacterium]|nr:HAD family hydrolase [Lachnospiraceae bacterium]
MTPHIICFDIDGTILDDQTGKVSEMTKKAIKQARENGHYAFINTGRSFSEIDPAILTLGFDGVICGCGTYITYNDHILLAKRIEGQRAEWLINTLSECKIDAMLEGEKYFYISKKIRNPKLIAVKDYFGEEVNKNFRYWEEQEPVFQKMSILLNPESDLEKFIEKCGGDYAFIRRSRNFHEVIPAGYSKATGIEYLMKFLGVAKEHTVAIGDSTNDLAMLEFSGISIAMGNSADEVKEKVTYVTKSVKEEGVAFCLKHFGFIK